MKLVKEYINEKFIEDSDPIKDMGIGTKFAYLKKGDIIKPNDEIYMRKISQKNDIYDTRYELLLNLEEPYRYRIPDFYYCLIMQAKFLKGENLYIEAVPFAQKRCV